MTVPASSSDDLRPRLQLALTEALRARDMAAVAALRSALAAVGNAEAVPPPAAVAAGEPGPAAPVTGAPVTGTPVTGAPVAGAAGPSSPHIAGAAAGLGVTEAERRRLSPAQVAAIVQAEIDERLEAATRNESAGHADRALRLRAQAQALAAAAE